MQWKARRRVVLSNAPERKVLVRRVGAALLDLVGGAIILALASAGTRILLQGRGTAYLLFPLLSLASGGLGYWRGDARMLPA